MELGNCTDYPTITLRELNRFRPSLLITVGDNWKRLASPTDRPPHHGRCLPVLNNGWGLQWLHLEYLPQHLSELDDLVRGMVTPGNSGQY